MPQSPEKIASPLSSFDANASATDIKDITIGGALLFAVLGGLILNLMPCVFPVLSMKVLSLSQISEKSALSAKQHGLAYTAGIILSFLFIASLLIVLKSGGSGIGWGFHLQNPIVILLLAYLFFMIGLNLSGFFEIGNRLMNIGSNTSQVGLRGSFMTGVLATVVATPCTAPFMAAALGYALVQPAYVALLIFAALGLGLALPYLMISFFPALQKAMPRPGAWMITFKEFLAFPMFATVIWLLWVLSQQIGSNGFFIPLMGILGLSLAVWFLNQSSHTDKVKKSILLSIGMITLLGSALSTIIAVQSIEMAKERPMPAFGQTFSEDSLEKALEGNDPVFVEMTAAWCVTCKVNNFTSIDIQQTRDILKKLNISYFIGDWTNYDPTITSYLNKYGRNGVPLYIFYGGRDNNSKLRPDPVILPQILTPSLVAETFNR
jgi:thiol:disulfide interchange protein DsbD